MIKSYQTADQKPEGAVKEIPREDLITNVKCLREELARMKGENELLREVIVKMAMSRYGVTNE